MKSNFKSKHFHRLLLIFSIFICALFYFSPCCFAAYPKLVSNIVSAFEKVENYIVTISTPAAAVSIGCRFFNAEI